MTRDPVTRERPEVTGRDASRDIKAHLVVSDDGTPALHVYTARSQPATRYRVDLGERYRWFTNPPRRRIPCASCRRVRVAASLTIQVYYDCARYQCAGGCRRKKRRRRQ